VFASITLPLALPGILAGVILGFARAIGEFGATITFVANIPGQTQTLASAIYSSTQDPAGEAATWRLTGVAIAVAVAALLASEALAARIAGRDAGE
jgi:molybdate transport system permease protein